MQHWNATRNDPRNHTKAHKETDTKNVPVRFVLLRVIWWIICLLSPDLPCLDLVSHLAGITQRDVGDQLHLRRRLIAGSASRADFRQRHADRDPDPHCI